jgi:predicted flap endonuclease-1-like 5' DNA nuclease
MSYKKWFVALPAISLILMGFTGNFAQESGSGALGWIGVLIALILLIPLVVWLRRSSESETAEHSHHSAESAYQKEAEAIATGADITPEDLVDAVVDEAEEVVEEVLDEDDQTTPARSDNTVATAPDTAESGAKSLGEAGTRAPTRRAQASAKTDDLTIIEGIGPKISRLLQDKDINTFAELAAANVGQIQEILTEAGLSNIAKPATWSEQAQLAAEGKWDDLKSLQDALKGGRRA